MSEKKEMESQNENGKDKASNRSPKVEFSLTNQDGEKTEYDADGSGLEGKVPGVMKLDDYLK